ncbi:Flagellar hook-associated protein 2 [Paenibacillus auburnensis]|uniref:Flagellar hook-associated protein 2 n=1 Tax=Paenibacillus auburnensis TaxID=2905649 RepID=A0ABM9CDZ0_9BACL|nr:flagellar filament capping protein FliD [Paenibacillus auburnensis]CAH1209570.1 Flagellar hook-associated protein 2 [Paenibacillus auburnensis]
MVTRVNGFSGIDVDTMVKNLMTAKRIPLDKLYQQKQTLEWTRDSYREINSKLVDFRNNKLVDKYGKGAALNTQKAVVSGNTDALKAEAGATANGIDMKVSITQVATKKTVETRGSSNPVASTKTLADIKIINTVPDPAILTDADKKALNEEEYKFTINGVSFVDSNGKSLFNGTTSIATVVSTINGNSKANVTAKYDEITGKLIISAKDTGKINTTTGSGKAEIVATDDNSLLDLFNQKYNAADPSMTTKYVTTDGQDSYAYVNGKQYTQASNTFTVNGVQLTLQKKTVDQADPTVAPTTGDTPVSITTTSDTETAMQTIKGFVEDYNTLLGLLNTKVDEAKYRDFAPLTDEQKTAMKDTDIANWTEKAKSGLLKNDDILRSALNQMRSVISGEVVKLGNLGITMGAYNSGGKIVLDETVLKKALTDNPQNAIDLFQGTGSDSTNGVFDKLADKITVTLDSLVKRVGTSKFSTDLTVSFKEESVMSKKLKEYNSRISTMLTNLENAETRYYKQFTAMETAMNKMQSQSSSLFSTAS